MTTFSEQMRAWGGPAILIYGFRPFFLGAGVWAALAMAFWVPMLSGRLTLPTAFDPVSWHAHEFLFGYLGAVIAGFLLTGVPNWTGWLPIVGWFLGALTAVIRREIVAGKDWHNPIVLAMLGVVAMGTAAFHWEAARGDHAAVEYGLRIGLGAAGLMTLAVMTRATLGHTGQTLTAGSGTVSIYAALVVAVLARLTAAIWPDQTHLLHMVAGVVWSVAFSGFAVIFGRLLLRLPTVKRM